MFYNISFLLPNTYDCFFYKIINNTNLCNELLYFEDIDVISDKLNSIDIDNKVYLFNNIKDILLAKQYIIFLKCCFFAQNSTFTDSPILSLNDFIKSNCNTIIFITDTQFVNIITKDEQIYKQLIINIDNYNFSNLTISKNSIKNNIFDFK